uniref:Receptor ligand binding region domain-containing protein n=1 Tax=Anopheles culicifacies TaxID=139723 RepID=A0A182MR86_9DIPT
MFHPDDDHQEIAFRYAVEKINSDRTILPRSKLLAQIERISPQDSFLASKRVCHLLGVGVAAIFGPQSSHTASHVQSICDTMEVWYQHCTTSAALGSHVSVLWRDVASLGTSAENPRHSDVRGRPASNLTSDPSCRSATGNHNRFTAANSSLPALVPSVAVSLNCNFRHTKCSSHCPCE